MELGIRRGDRDGPKESAPLDAHPDPYRSWNRVVKLQKMNPRKTTPSTREATAMAVTPRNTAVGTCRSSPETGRFLMPGIRLERAPMTSASKAPNTRKSPAGAADGPSI